MHYEGSKAEKFLHSLIVRRHMSMTDWLVDIVICAGAVGFGLLQLTLSADVLIPDDFMRRLLGVNLVAPSYIAIVATLLTCLPTIVRRASPWTAFVLSTGFWIGFELSYELSSLSLAGPLVSLFTLAYLCGRWQTLVACIIELAVIMTAASSSFSSTMTKLLVLQNSVLAIAVSFAGYALYTRQEYIEEANARAAKEESLRESETLRAQEAERSREAEARRRVEEERSRIGRELHDITAHSLTAISIQSEAALRLIDVDPKAAREPMEAVRAISKDSLEEIRSMIGALRTGEENLSESMEPMHTLEDMSYLCRYLDNAGIECDLDINLDINQVPAYIGVALYGIAREAVTNVVKHAHADKAWIKLQKTSDNSMFVMSVDDNGVGIDNIYDSNGRHGVDGMKERTDALGGFFSIGNSNYGGAKIEVKLPIADISESVNK